MNPLQLVHGIPVDPAAVERLGWVLLHFLWQGAVAAALLAVASWMLRNRSAAARYRVACVALLAIAAAPVVTFWAIGDGGNSPTAGAVTAPAAGPAAAAGPRRPAVFVAPLPPAMDGPAVAAPPPPAGPLSGRAATFGWVVAAWALGVAGLSVWRLGGWVYLRRLLQQTEGLGPAWDERLGRLARRLGVTRPVRLARATWVQVPAVVGALRPVVLVPVAAVSGLTPAQVEALLAHELAHVRRHDYLVNLFQAAVETVLFYHPAVWWVSARIREERENACDDLAAGACGDAAGYAAALAAMEELRPPPAHLAVAAGGAGGPSLVRRVRRLLGLAPPARGRTGPRSLAAAVVAAACVALPVVAVALARADKEPPPAARPETLPETRPATGPAAGPGRAGDGVETSPITDADLAAEEKDYTISPNDLLSVTIGDLSGPGVNTVKAARVTEGGNISLPYVGQLAAKGLTEAELEAAIAKLYRDKNLVQNAPVTVSVTERRGRTFSVMGRVGRPGQYSILEANFRLLDALGQGDATLAAGQTVRVIRRPAADKAEKGEKGEKGEEREKTDKGQRVIDVPADKLMAGDAKYNLVVRPGDMLLVIGPEAAPARLVVAPDGLTFRDRRTTWDDLPALLESIPAAERSRMVLTVVPATDELTLRQLNDARRRAADLARRLGLAGSAVADPPASAPPATGPAGRE